MKSLKGTKTAENLMKAFAGESQARNRYTYYASQAKKEGYVQISNFFIETANNEKEHGKVFFKFLSKDFINEKIVVNADYPIELGDTKSNLSAAADGEYDEWHNLYPNFAKEASEEGFTGIASAFNSIISAEKAHEKRFRKLESNIENNIVFKREANSIWKCSNCGFIFIGSEPPEICPACAHPKAYFELVKENY